MTREGQGVPRAAARGFGYEREAGVGDSKERFAIVASLTLAVAALAVFAPSAFAVDAGHSFSFSFTGSGTNELSASIPNIEVDNSTGPSAGDVYVDDAGHHRVVKFGPDGHFILMFGGGVNASTGGDVCTAASGDTCQAGAEGGADDQFENPNKIAIDQTSGPSRGDVYIVDGEKRVIKYDENGHLLTGWGVGGVLRGETTELGSFEGIRGIDVDSAGELLVPSGYSVKRLSRFSESGAYLGEYELSFSLGTGFAWSPSGFNNYLNGEDGSVKRSKTANGAEFVSLSKFFYNPGSLYGRDIDADPATGTVYLVLEDLSNSNTQIDEWRVDGSGQPLDALGAPCAVTLTAASPGCDPTHEFGIGNSNDPSSVGYQSGVAVDSAANRVYTTAQTDGYSKGRVNVYVGAPAPLVETGDPVGKRKVSGTVSPDGAGEVVECYFEYGTSPSYGSKQDCSPAAPFSSDQAVTADLPIAAESLYHYRLVAKNAAGATNFGADKTITPHNVDGLGTLPAENVTRIAARLNGSFQGNEEATTYYFEWGLSESYGHKTYEPGSGPGSSAGSPQYPPATPLTFELEGLEPETEYHYRVVATNGQGTTRGNDVTFETLPAVQALTTTAATDVARKSVTLNGSFLGDGDGTTFAFEWGKTESYGSLTPEGDAGSPSGAEPVSLPLAGLELETTYHYRVVATNSLGTTRGADQSFTTLPAVTSVVTKPATAIGQDTVTLNAEYTGNGEDTHYYFEYGLTGGYGQVSEAAPGSDAGAAPGAHQIASTISQYEGYETYHYRVVASNSFGNTYGEDQTFVALPAPLPEIEGTTASGVHPTAVTLEAAINPNRWATVYSFEYGPSAAYGSSTEIGSSIGADKTMHSVSASVGNLTPGTVYHFRVIAINFSGTTYGPDQTVATPDAPRIESTTASAVSQAGARLSGAVNPASGTTSAHFEYGASGAYGSATGTVAVGSDTSIHPVSADLSGLQPSTTYHFRLVASNEYGTTRGPDQTFTTGPADGFGEPLAKPIPCRKGYLKGHNGKCVKRKHHKKRHHKTTGRQGA